MPTIIYILQLVTKQSIMNRVSIVMALIVKTFPLRKCSHDHSQDKTIEACSYNNMHERDTESFWGRTYISWQNKNSLSSLIIYNKEISQLIHCLSVFLTIHSSRILKISSKCSKTLKLLRSSGNWQTHRQTYRKLTTITLRLRSC